MSTPSSPGGAASAVPNSTTAILSLVAGILGLTAFPFIGSIVAVITGTMAKREIEASAGSLGGEGMATAGLVLGWIGIALGVLGLCVGVSLVAVPCLLALTLGGEFQSLVPGLLALVAW
jgi:hypothetical protein